MFNLTLSSLHRQINFSFAILIFVSSVITSFLLISSIHLLERSALSEWLQSEYEHYSRVYERTQRSPEYINVDRFTYYWTEINELPGWLSSYQEEGVWEYDLPWWHYDTNFEDSTFLIKPHPSGDGLLYIVFNVDADDYLDGHEYILFLYNVLLVLVSIGLTMFFAMFLTKNIRFYLAKLHETIESTSPNQVFKSFQSPFEEIQKIEKRLYAHKQLIDKLFLREKEFSRFASHELRTPIMIIKGSVDVMKRIDDLPPVALRSINRIDRAGSDMSILTDALLLLGGDCPEKYMQNVDVISLIHKQIDVMSDALHFPIDRIQLYVVPQACKVHAPTSFITIVINNLLKNAMVHYIDYVYIDVLDLGIVIRNKFGPSENTESYGVGLLVVKKICKKMNWKLTTSIHKLCYSVHIEFETY